MEIGLVYSSKDPRQARTRAFLFKYVKERGILARIIESEQPVKVPTITVNGWSIIGPGVTPGQSSGPRSPFPSTKEIAKVLDRSIWCL